MNPFPRKRAALLASMAMLAALGACNRAADRTAIERLETGVAATSRAGADDRRDSNEASSRAAATNTAATATATPDSQPTDRTRTMGAAAEKVDDASITAKVNASLAKDRDLSAIRIDVDTQDGVVTLSGLAPSASTKERASELAHRVPGVHSVNNQLTIKSS